MNTSKRTVLVWDLFVRCFHWALVLAIIIQYASAETFKTLHYYTGYLIIFLVVARIAWGFVGTHHARFKSFLYKPSTVSDYLKGLLTNRPKHYLGHNPAGGLMIVILLAALLGTTFTGLKALGQKGSGPFAIAPARVVNGAYADQENHTNGGKSAYDTSHVANRHNDGLWKEIHEAMTGLVIFLIIVHICGVVVSSWLHRENLILAMLTGKKNV